MLDDRIAALTDAPLQLDVSTVLRASPNEVFDFVVDFPNLPQWMPLMRRVDVDDSRAESPGGVGAVRIVHPPVGRPTHETVRAFERPRLLAYSASDETLRGLYTDHTGVLLCEEDGHATRLRWLTFGRPGRSPVLRWIGRWIFAYVVRTSVRNLERHFNSHRSDREARSG